MGMIMLLLMVIGAGFMVELRSLAVTAPSDVQALIQIRAALDPNTIQPSSCVSTWDLTFDPCDNLNRSPYFECGFQCQVDASGLLRITSLTLDAAGYKGTLSPAVGRLSALQLFSIAGNSISGDMPGSIGELNELIGLDLSSNALTGPLPDSLGLLKNLQTLNLANNLFHGRMPSLLGDVATTITDIRLQNNRLSGHLPDLSPLSELQMLDLSNNLLSGSLPLLLPPSLVSVSFAGNQLSGGLTKDHVKGLSPVLRVFDLRNNKLSGAMDSSLFIHPSLQQLNLSHNKFTAITGTVDPSSIVASQVVAIDMSFNRIQGSLPAWLSSMKHLSSLSLSQNAFSGRIPVSYGIKALAGLIGLEPLRRLMLDGNYLIGPLPSFFMRLLPDRIMVSVVDNCLWSCPASLFFCQGRVQKPKSACMLFNASQD